MKATAWLVAGLLSLILPLHTRAAENPSSPSGTLTLSDAVSEARANSAELKRLEASSDAASWSKIQALSTYIPHLDIEGEHDFSMKYMRLGIVFGGAEINFPEAMPQTLLSLTASITVFDGLQGWNQYRAASFDYDASQHELQYAKFAVDHDVRLKFYQALGAQMILDVADQNIKSLEDHLKIARAVERSGAGTRFGVLRLEAQLEEAQAERMLSNDNVAIARRSLAVAMGLSKDDTRALTGDLPVPNVAPAVQTLALEQNEREDIKALIAREESVAKQSDASFGPWFPRVSLFGSEQLYKFGSFDPIVLSSDTFQSAYSIGVRLRWNLFDGGATIARRYEAAARAKAAAERTHGTLIAVPADFELWKRRFIYNTALYKARLRTVEKSQESVRLAMAALRAGTSTNTDVLDAELDLFRARAGVVRAQLDAEEAFTKLELAVGKNLPRG